MRTCRTCGREFRPSSRHHDCPACRSRDHRACGDPKQVKSVELVLGVLFARGQVGPGNHNWKEGRKHQTGYLMVRMPGHPRARTHGYLFEHILVMEAKLGRMLFADESGYHKNGIRDDNSTEDLELWIRTHPSGMRALEAVAWARKIISRYGELN